MEYIDRLSYNMPVWSQIDETPTQFPWLDEDLQAEICVIGGGMTGAMCAMRLAEDGHDVLLITDGAVGMGETARMMPCAVTDLGRNIVSLRRRLGDDRTEWLLSSAAEQLDALETLAYEQETGSGSEDKTLRELYDFGFSRSDCFLFTDDESERELLGKEFSERRGLVRDCVFVGRSAAMDMFNFETVGGVMLPEQAAVFDPYRLTHYCAARAMLGGARIYENTKAMRIERLDDGGWTVVTSTHRIVECDRVVVAAGEACGELIDGIGAPRTFYTVVSRTLRDMERSGWSGQCVLRTLSDPEMTMCLTPDRRIFACGLSSGLMDENARFAGLLRFPYIHEKRFAELEAGARYLCQEGVGGSAFEYAQAARMCRTADGLPIVGEPAGSEGCCFAVSGGGALMSLLCARTVAEICAGDEPPEIIAPCRRTLRIRSA